MKIITFVIPSLETGGAELQLVNQLNYLAARGAVNIKLLVLSGRTPLLEEFELPQSSAVALSWNQHNTISKPLFAALPRLVRETALQLNAFGTTDIIAILPMAHLVCRLAKLWVALARLRWPNLTTYYRDVYFDASPLDTLAKRAFNWLNSGLARLTDSHTLFVSPAVQTNIEAHFFVRQPLSLPNSLPDREVDSTLGADWLKAKNFTPSACYSILFPGRLHSKKGHHLFLDAFNRLSKSLDPSDPPLVAIVAGEGPLLEDLQARIASLGLEKSVHLVGNLPNQVLLSLYKCVDLVVIPSIHEGFGNVAIEGLMQRSLMLVAETGGLADIVTDGETGFFFRPGDGHDLEAKLRFIYQRRDETLVDPQALKNEFLEKYTLRIQLETIYQHCGLGIVP